MDNLEGASVSEWWKYTKAVKLTVWRFWLDSFFQVFEGEKSMWEKICTTATNTNTTNFSCDVCQYVDLHSQHKAECGRKFKKSAPGRRK